MKEKIHFIITGGTIDSSYFTPAEKMRPHKDSIIPPYIRDVVQPHFTPTFETVCMKDSGDLTETDRKKMLAAVKKTPAKKIVITHGTVTLTQTAEFLAARLKDTDKIVTLVGAMLPMRQLVMSDGGFNIGFAIGSMTSLQPGVYLCMNGRVFIPGHVKKNIEKARFE